MSAHDEGDAWDAVWAVICLILGEATTFMTVYPTLRDVPGFSREGLTVGFGLLLTATYFLMGLPVVTILRSTVNWIIGKFRGRSQASPKES